MLTRIALVLALALGTFAACDAAAPMPVGDAGAEVAQGVDAGAEVPCQLTPIASITGSCNSYPIPLPYANPDVEHMTVYVDGAALSANDWTTNSHAITITTCVPGDSAQHLVAVSFGCVASH